MKRSLARVFVAALALAAASPVTSCASRPSESSGPELVLGSVDPEGFARGADAVFERRCGSLDCHGTRTRGLRIYGANGLRLPNDAGLVPGGGATTAEEMHASYASILAVDPTNMNAFLLKSPRTEDDARALVVLTKGTATERHKGGAALVRGEPAEECVVTWLLGHTDLGLCAQAAGLP